MAKILLLDEVTVAGPSDLTFTVSDTHQTVEAEGLSDGELLAIQKLKIDGLSYKDYRPDGKTVFLSNLHPEVNIFGKGTYRVNLLEIPKAAVSCSATE